MGWKERGGNTVLTSTCDLNGLKRKKMREYILRLLTTLVEFAHETMGKSEPCGRKAGVGEEKGVVGRG